MTLPSGSRLGSYQILSPLGAGGMGEVYRARDTNLGRDVAIKTLPAEFARDPERLARFAREARLLASLNHPNIAAIYGLEEADGAKYLVLECVEGETLAERLAAGPLPVEEALAVGIQIASGLEAAHEAGVIHRDLKPGNVMIRPDGSVKVLDFGLGKAGARESVGSTEDQSRSPTISAGTEAGVILGTAAYMSPEQARGRPLDKRTDIFSFGCVLYESLSGKQAFRGDTVSDTLAAILKSEPDWSALSLDTPMKIRDLLRRSLQKDSRRRLHDIADARIEIEEALAAPRDIAAGERGGELPAAAGRQRAVWGLAGLAVGAILALLLIRFVTPTRPAETMPSIRSVLPLPPETRLQVQAERPSLELSPDGRRLVFRAIRDGVEQLYLRSLDRGETVPLPGTEGGFNPFFSPDGEWLGFFTGRELKKAPLAGGTPVTICGVPPVTQGASWGSDGLILFAPSTSSGLSRVPAAGGAAEVFTTPSKEKGEHAHAWPQILPGGRDVLFAVRVGKDFQEIEKSNIAVRSLSTGKQRVLIEGSTFARYVPPGYMLFLRGRTLLAARCDPDSFELTGPAAPVLEDVMIGAGDWTAFFAAASNGNLIYAAGGIVPPFTETLAWVNREGKEEPVTLPPQNYGNPRLAPDGRRLALVAGTQRFGIWIHDPARDVLSPLTPEAGRHFNPAWTPDGKRVAFSSRFESGLPRLYWKASDGSGESEPLTEDPGSAAEFPASFSPDGRVLAYIAVTPGRADSDIWLLSLEGGRKARPWFQTPFREVSPMFSPDGRWIAYSSDDSGRNEVYVRPYPGPGGKIKISNEGGAEPAWSRDGRELFYRSGDKMMAVAIRAEPEFVAGIPKALFSGGYSTGGTEVRPWDYEVSPDGKRFLMIKPVETKQAPVTSLNLVTNWFGDLERAAAKKP